MIGSGEMIVILGLGLLLFGSKRVPELAKSLGVGLREFKRACQGLEDDERNDPRSSAPTAVPERKPDDHVSS